MQLFPFDGASKDPEFLRFRAALLGAVQRRDAKYLINALRWDVQVWRDERGNLEHFVDEYKPDDPNSEVWQVLEEILSMGGDFIKPGVFVAPYVAASFPAECNPLKHLVLTQKDFPLRAAGRPDAEIVAHISFEIVENIGFADGPHGTSREGFFRVRLEDGREGYLPERVLRSPWDYSIGFSHNVQEFKNGKGSMGVGPWLITGLVSETGQ